ncbi:MAG TPA: CHASE2 domain-containing protein, partial [Bryobacteraceae bacterium]
MVRPHEKRPADSRAIYWGLLAASLLFGVWLNSTGFGRQLDDNAYDFFFRHYQPKPWPLTSALLTIDEKTLQQFNGIRGERKALAAGLNLIRNAHPRAVAVDIILADTSEDDEALESAFASTRNLVLPCELAAGNWEDPIARFKRHATALGQVYVEPIGDAISRYIELYKVAGEHGRADRRWVLALEAYRVSRGAQITESPHDLQVGDVIIPADKEPSAFGYLPSGYAMRIRYVPASMATIPAVSIADLVAEPSRARVFTDKVVFAGVSAQTAARDRWMTPLSDSTPMAGIEMNANAYETIASGQFLVDAS